MRRVVAWSLTLVVVAFGLLWPVLFAGFFTTGSTGAPPADDPVVITDYRAAFTVTAAGDLTATETITGDFPPARHGIFRYFDVTNRNDASARQPPRITSILVDGSPADYQLLSESWDRFRVAKIGDPDVTLNPGPHTYEIRYTVAGVLDPGATGAQSRFAGQVGDPGGAASTFFWNVLAPSWNNRIERFRATVTLPAAVTGAQCSVGLGVGSPCTGLTVDGDTVAFGATDLPPRTPVTLRAGVDVPTPPRLSLPWSQPADRVFGQSVVTVVWVAAFTVAAAALGYLWNRTTVEPAPGFPVQYEPPPGLGPVQVEFIRTEAVPDNGLTATLFHLAEHRFVELHRDRDEQWTVRGIASRKDWIDLDPVAKAVGAALEIDTRDSRFTAKKTASAGKRLDTAKDDLEAAVRKWAFDGGLLVKRSSELWVRTASALAFVLALCGFLRWGFPATMWGLPFAAFFLATVSSWRAGVGTRRTEAGRQLWSRAQGFHRLLSTDSAETRFDFAARKDLYTAYVPFAVAAGVAAAWAEKYQTATGTVAPQPQWYGTSSGTTWAAVNEAGTANFDDFDSALSSSIDAYTASQSSSSSSGGSSGGGFSGAGGGGGGGGGGGSW